MEFNNIITTLLQSILHVFVKPNNAILDFDDGYNKGNNFVPMSSSRSYSSRTTRTSSSRRRPSSRPSDFDLEREAYLDELDRLDRERERRLRRMR